MTNREVAETILAQLGGRRFSAMTGAKDFMVLSTDLGGLQFKVPKVFDKPGCIMQITLNASDLYDIKIFKGRGVNLKKTKEINDVFCDMLQEIFETETGLYTHL